MQRRDFSYELPPELIAQSPPADRAGGRLLVLPPANDVLDRTIRDLVSQLRPGDMLVFNDSKVIRARVLGHKATGGKAELLVERLLSATRVRAFVKASKTPGEGSTLHFANDVSATIVERSGGLFIVEFDTPVLPFLERHGDIPLPPYIQRDTDDEDPARYQTIYANEPGSAAAPTAGLHFDQALLTALDDHGVHRASVTLHVGAGTFEPMRVEDIAEHTMHSEYAVLGKATCERIQAAREQGGRIVSVGTTSLRTLETAAQGGTLQPFEGDTNIFIYPGWKFRAVDGLLTNFHLPESTLMMLVCALGGYHRMLAAYRHAVRERYRFFSYGDAMLIWPHTS
ncbi:MAG: tRNA preQ1(34) S-adenosylmethionine ribosyltransferase-isomerase QueA [Gammaproteobacteria bacterium]